MKQVTTTAALQFPASCWYQEHSMNAGLKAENLDDLIGSLELETDPKRLALNQAFLEWEEKIFSIRRQMRKGQMDETTASAMAEQVSQEYWVAVNGLSK